MMKRSIRAGFLALCLLLMAACGKKAAEESAVVCTVEPTTVPVTESVAEPTEPASAQLLEHPEDGKICVGFLPTEAGHWRYAVIEDQEAALAAYEKAAGAIYSDEWWIKGDRTKGLMVVAEGEFWDFVESGELVYALGRVKAEDAADLYALCAATATEAGWKEAVRPDQLKHIVSATLRQGEKTVSLSDAAALEKLEAMLSAGTFELGGTGCPFTALLDVNLENGETLTVALATDSCGVWMSEGCYYSYAGDSQVLFDLFGVTFPFGKMEMK
ncbi:MAG: hypothetical protein U0N82_02870 [Oscillospiraceae bacterium]